MEDFLLEVSDCNIKKYLRELYSSSQQSKKKTEEFWIWVDLNLDKKRFHTQAEYGRLKSISILFVLKNNTLNWETQ